MSTNVKSLSAILGSPPQSASAIVSARGAGEEPPEYEPFAQGRLANRPQLMVVFRKGNRTPQPILTGALHLPA